MNEKAKKIKDKLGEKRFKNLIIGILGNLNNKPNYPTYATLKDVYNLKTNELQEIIDLLKKRKE